jgi:hypothetical protein
MEATMTIQNDPNAQSPEKGIGCLAALTRMAWLFFGIFAMWFCALFIAMRKAPGISDILFGILAVAVIIIRYIDIKVFRGETADNAPATLKDWRRYTIRLILMAGILYAAAKTAAHYNIF